MKRAAFCLVPVTLVVLLFLSCFSEAESLVPERRKHQYDTRFGYALFPYPYSLPGVGQGLGFVGGAMNIDGTTADAYGMIFGGDVKGIAAGIADVQLVPRTLILDFGESRMSAATIQNYSVRGMNSDKNDYTNAEFGEVIYYGARMTASFSERRYEFYSAWYQGTLQLKNIRDKDGNIIMPADDAEVQRGHATIVGARLDLTDDYADPHRGVRLDVSRTITPPKDSGPDYYQQDYSLSAFVPIGKRNTWAFNFLRSDAHVNSIGETDRSVIEEQQGLQCEYIADPAQKRFCDNVINNMIENNKYGTASSLGGFSRLRSYPTGRFKGAHTLFYGTEFRWNLTEESTPFDIFIMRDVRTCWQLAFFRETGSVADKREDLGDIWRSTTGIGLRMVTASGMVFRADLATGQDGFSPSIFIGYPWEL